MGHWLNDWLPDILPAISNIVLVAVGILLSLPKLAETVEVTPKYRKWLAAVCLAAGFVGGGFEIAQRHSTTKTTTQLLGRVQITLDNTQQLVTQFNLWSPTLTSIRQEIDGLQLRLNTAIKNNDLRKAAEIENQIQQKQKIADAVTLELLVANLSSLVSSVQEPIQDWVADEKNAYLFYYERKEHAEWEHKSEAEKQEIEENWATNKVSIRKNHYTPELQRMVRDVVSLREEILKRIPRAPTDASIDVLVARGSSGNSESNEMSTVVDYLRVLVERARTAKTE